MSFTLTRKRANIGNVDCHDPPSPRWSAAIFASGSQRATQMPSSNGCIHELIASPCHNSEAA
eukprot:5811582-Alexandrium_andersonii.AAC.1